MAILLTFMPTIMFGELRAEDLKSASLDLVSKYLDRGNVRIGSLDLKQVEADFLATNWILFRDGFAHGAGNQRHSAVNLVEKRAIVYNVLAHDHAPVDIQKLVASHEAFGANGYNDDNYQLVISLEILRGNPEFGKELFLSYLTNLDAKRLHDQRELHAGGVTSVGRGGDGTSLELKLRVVKKAIESFKYLTSSKEILKGESMLRRIMDTSFEPNWNTDNQLPAALNRNAQSLQFIVFHPSLTWYIMGLEPNGSASKDRYARRVLFMFDDEITPAPAKSLSMDAQP